MLDPVTAAIGAYLIPKILEKLGEKTDAKSKQTGQKQPASKSRPRPNHRLSDAQAARFTRIEDGIRFFDPDISRALVMALAGRSVTHDDRPSPQAPGARIWKVGPASSKAMPAQRVFDMARSRGECVIGSLSLALIQTGKDVKMLLVTAPRSLAYQLSQAHVGQLAILEEPPRARVLAQEPPAPEKPEPEKPEQPKPEPEKPKPEVPEQPEQDTKAAKKAAREAREAAKLAQANGTPNGAQESQITTTEGASPGEA